MQLPTGSEDFQRRGNTDPHTHTNFQHTRARSHTLCLLLRTCTGTVGATHEEVPLQLGHSSLHWAGILGFFWPSLTRRHSCSSPTEERRCRNRITGANKSNGGEGKREKTASTELKMKNKSAFLAGTATPPREKKKENWASPTNKYGKKEKNSKYVHEKGTHAHNMCRPPEGKWR